ncbi:MAG: hypothetical protein IJW75_04515, partial [Alphaproteobacteria bacterium]|nr:hypothetical protein [Alphaproteobacteria bacterium]
ERIDGATVSGGYVPTSTCKSGYTLTDGKCVSNCTYADEAACESANANSDCTDVDGCYELTGCKSGYTLTDGKCVANTSATTCEDIATGSDYLKLATGKCPSGFSLGAPAQIDGMVCTVCCKYSSGSACESANTGTVCESDDEYDACPVPSTTCKDGYKLVDGRCQSEDVYYGCEYSSIAECEDDNSFSVCEEVPNAHFGYSVCPEMTGCKSGYTFTESGECVASGSSGSGSDDDDSGSTVTCTYTSASACQGVYTKSTCTADSDGCYNPSSCASGYAKSCSSGYSLTSTDSYGCGTCKKNCTYTSASACQAVYTKSTCTADSNGCYNPSACASGYTKSCSGGTLSGTDGYGCGTCITDSCTVKTYPAFTTALENANCTTVTLASDIDGSTDDIDSSLTIPANKTVNGAGYELKMSRTISPSDGVTIKNLDMTWPNNGTEYEGAISVVANATFNNVNITTTATSGENYALHLSDASMLKFTGTNTITVKDAGENVAITSDGGTIEVSDGSTLDINVNAGVGIYASSDSYLNVNGTLNMDIEGYTAIIDSAYITVNGNLNIDYTGSSEAINSMRAITVSEGGYMKVVSNSTDTTMYLDPMHGKVNIGGTLEIEAPATKFIANEESGILFTDANAKLIINSTGSKTFSDTDAGLTGMFPIATAGATISVTDSKGSCKEWKCNTTYDIGWGDFPSNYPTPKSNWTVSNCEIESACQGYSHTSCPAGATKCETCEDNGTTYYKAITCDESQGYYHSDGECKPRDCSDFTWDTCPPNSSCDSTSCFDTNSCISKYGSPNYSNDICISAGKITYQLSYCKLGYFESGTEGCIKRNCENFDFTSRPKNMATEQCGGRYSAEKCSDAVPYVHYQNGECVVYGDAACVNHKLTEIPANANYSTCSPDGGTTKYYQFTYCESGYNFVDGACVEPSGVTETDYPFTTEAECTNGNFLCSYSSAIVPSERRYKRTRCAYGFHYDNGICIENDCSAYPFRYDRFDNNSPYMGGPSCEKPLPADGSITDRDGRLTYIMLRQCSPGYKFDPNGTDCIKSITPPEARCYPNDGCSTNGYCPNQFTNRVCKNSNTYTYW